MRATTMALGEKHAPLEGLHFQVWQWIHRSGPDVHGLAGSALTQSRWTLVCSLNLLPQFTKPVPARWLRLLGSKSEKMPADHRGEWSVDSGRNTESQRVRTGPEVPGVWPHRSYLQTGLLREQAGPPAHGPDLYGWHGAADVQVFICGTTRFH